MNIDKWQLLSFPEQIGNICSELSRAKNWEKIGDFTNRENALKRSINLVDLTISDCREKSGLKELTRFREILYDLITESNLYNTSLKELENFCLPFALIARK